MSGGGLTQLVANGVQPVYVYREPEVRFYNVTYRHYQNYSLPIDVPIEKPRFTVIEINRRRPNKLAECPICLESIAHMDMAITNCNHQVCNTCINKLVKCTCPLCRADIICIQVDPRRAE